MDRSKYSSDMPVGYVKKRPEAIKIDGVHYSYLGYVIDSGCFEQNCRDSLFKDDDDEVIEVSNKKNKKYQIEKAKRKMKNLSSDDCSSESSYQSSSYSKYKQSLVKYSLSLSPKYYTDVRVKDYEEPSYLLGYYNCQICNITMKNLSAYNIHVSGKRHLKNLKLKNVPDAVVKTVPSAATEGLTKYPKPASGVVRRRVKKRAEIQNLIEKEVKTPCPGLYFVTEIQGIVDTQYYCSICDSICSTNSIIPHLKGYKHQLRSLKHFKPGVYEDISYKPKHLIYNQIKHILNAVQKKEGLGRMAVEVEELFSKDMEIMGTGSQPCTSRNEGPNFRNSGMEFTDYYDMATIPDTSSSDFFCRICHSHMNSQQMWEAHVRGKRHLTNLKKMPGDKPSKNPYIQINKPAVLLKRLDSEQISEPIVGLSVIQELWIPETESETYKCFLCGAGLTSIDIMDHVLSYKHRTKYLNHVEYPGSQDISSMHEQTAYSIVEQLCGQLELLEGRGKPSVHTTKSAIHK